jgi:hypothetical protein
MILSDIVVSAGRETLLAAHMQETVQLAEEVVVHASYFMRPEGVTTGSFTMSYEEVRRAPGALGDVTRIVQALPAAIVRDYQLNDIMARGGSPSENLILVDGIEVPNLSHFGGQGTAGGPITMLNPETISDVRFLAGGFTAAYGNRLSSVLEVSLREGNRDRVEAEFNLDMAGDGLLLEGPVGRRGSWLVSGRRSYLDPIADAYGLTAVPQYASFQTKAVYDLSPRNSISLVGIGGWDAIRFDVDTEDLDNPNTLLIDMEGWRSVAGLNWQTLFGQSAALNLCLSRADSNFKNEIRDTQLDDALVVHNHSRERETNARWELSWRIGSLGTLQAGVFGKQLASSFDYAQHIGQEDVFSNDPERINTLALDENVTTWQAGGYIEAHPRLGRWATSVRGVRYEFYDIHSAGELSPRGGLTFHLRPNLDLSATYGRYAQTPPLIFMKAHPDNARLRRIRAEHFVSGLAYRPWPATQITIEGYHKRYSRYPVSTQFRSLSDADAGEQSDVSFYMLPYVSEGEGRSSGIEAYLQQKLSGHVWGQVSYSHSRTENRALDGIWRSGTFDLPDVLSFVAVKAMWGQNTTARVRLAGRLHGDRWHQHLVLRPSSLSSMRMPIQSTSSAAAPRLPSDTSAISA